MRRDESDVIKLNYLEFKGEGEIEVAIAFKPLRDAAQRPRAMTAADTQLGDQRLRTGTAVPIWTFLYEAMRQPE